MGSNAPVSQADIWQKLDDVFGSENYVAKPYDWSIPVTAEAVWTPASGKRIILCDVFCSVDAECTVTLFEDTDDLAHRIRKAYLAANGGFPFNPRKLRRCAVDGVIKITATAGPGTIMLEGYEI